MKLFHVSDLHLGKTLHGYDLLADQSYILDAIVARIGEMEPDALLVAGDIYDRAVPPVDAIRLFDTFLLKAREARPGLEIVIIPGNHDSAGRLSFGATMLADSGVHISTRVSPLPAIVLEKDGMRMAIWAAPFLSQASAMWSPPAGANGAVAGETIPRSQQELMKRALDSIRPNLDSSMVNVLVGHCFAAGGLAGDSEQAFVGAAEQIDTALFADFDYVALGHLHTRQSPAPRVWYSGSPLPYSVLDAEREKGFVVVEFLPEPKTPRIVFVPLAPRRNIRRLSGFFAELLANPLPQEARQDYIEIALCDAAPVLNPMERFKQVYPNILEVRQAAFEKAWGAGGMNPDGTANLGVSATNPDGTGAAPGAAADRLRTSSRDGDKLETAKSDFLAFYREMRGEEPSPEMTHLFESIAQEAANAPD